MKEASSIDSEGEISEKLNTELSNALEYYTGVEPKLKHFQIVVSKDEKTVSFDLKVLHFKCEYFR